MLGMKPMLPTRISVFFFFFLFLKFVAGNAGNSHVRFKYSGKFIEMDVDSQTKIAFREISRHLKDKLILE